MTIARRDVLKGIGGLAVSMALAPAGTAPVGVLGGLSRAGELPRKQDFDLSDGYTYLNAAYTHPIPRPVADAMRAYLEQRGKLAMPHPGSGGGASGAPDARSLFAELINASPSEIAYVSSTSVAENLVVDALGLDRASGVNVVTDWLHYDGALIHLLELQRHGLEIRIARPTPEFRIDVNDLARLMDRNTRLVEVSSTAMYNGFQHDLKAVCDAAHAQGALVYADIIHTAGAEPFDVKASGVDFAACSSFKWLMGDYGLGFLYARDDLMDKIHRPVVGYYQAEHMTGHEPPVDIVGATQPVDWLFRRDATGHFEVGSIAGALGAGLHASLAYIEELGVPRIAAYRQPLIKRLRDEIPKLGFPCVTPPESTAGIITFARKGLGAVVTPRLDRARVNVRVADNWMRVSPSIYNDMADVDRLLAALA